MIKTVYCGEDDILVIFGKDHIDFMFQMLQKAKEQGLIITTENKKQTKTYVCKFCGNGEIVNLKNNHLIMSEKINHNMGCLIPRINGDLIRCINDISCDVAITHNQIEILVLGLNEIIELVDLSTLDSTKLLQVTTLISPLMKEIEHER